MIPRLHITASVQPQHLSYNELPAGRVPAVAMEHGISEEFTRDVHSRLARLEEEVFKARTSLNAESRSIISSPNSDGVLPGYDRDIHSSAGKTWSCVIEEIVRRLDSCAGQASVNECVISMRQLKRDLSQFAERLDGSRMSESQAGAFEAFGIGGGTVELFKEVKTDISEKDDRVEKPTLPLHIVKAAPNLTNELKWKSSNNRQGGKTYSFLQRGSQKKWGPCFYCPCTDWKPGHTCEGSLAAQLRRKERESRGS